MVLEEKSTCLKYTRRTSKYTKSGRVRISAGDLCYFQSNKIKSNLWILISNVTMVYPRPVLLRQSDQYRLCKSNLVIFKFDFKACLYYTLSKWRRNRLKRSFMFCISYSYIISDASFSRNNWTWHKDHETFLDLGQNLFNSKYWKNKEF